MSIEQLAIPILIKDFTTIYDAAIEEELKNHINFRKLRFNLAVALMDLYNKIGKVPYNRELRLKHA